MNPAAIIASVHNRGASITLTVDPNGIERLIIEPASKCRDLLPAIREAKDHLIAILRRNSDNRDWARAIANRTATNDQYLQAVLKVYHTYEHRFPGWSVPDIDRAIDRTIALECLKRTGGTS